MTPTATVPEVQSRTDRVWRIAVIAGDGIGKEVVPPCLPLIRLAMGSDAAIEFIEFPWSCDYYLQHGKMMPDDGLETLRTFDAIFLGAVGDPARVPDHISTWDLIIRIRRGLQQSLNLRPARLLSGMHSPLRDPGPVDLLVIRENTEGEYSQVGGLFGEGSDEQAIQVSVFTRIATERAIRHGFEQARRRRKHLVAATKSNGITHTMPFWDRIFYEVALEYPDVEARVEHVDALAARFMTAPSSLDVVVASNLFGDILTDLSSALMGSIGMGPSGNIDPSGTQPSMFEPVHGSAPDIAGKGIANPIGQIWSAAMMLEHLGMETSANRLIAAIEETLVAGEFTPDLGGSLTTLEMIGAVERRLSAV